MSIAADLYIFPGKGNIIAVRPLQEAGRDLIAVGGQMPPPNGAETGLRQASVQVQAADVIIRRYRRRVDVQFSGSLVAAIVRIVAALPPADQIAAAEFLGLPIAPLEQQFPHGWQLCAAIRVVPIRRITAPQALFIELQRLPFPSAEDHHAQTSAAEGKGFIPVSGRLPVPKHSAGLVIHGVPPLT